MILPLRREQYPADHGEGGERGASRPGSGTTMSTFSLHRLPDPHAAMLGHKARSQTQLPG